MVVPDPNAESAEFSRECDTDGDLEPEDGGLKNESGNFRIRNGICSGSLLLSVLSNSSFSLSLESLATRRIRFSFFLAPSFSSEVLVLLAALVLLLGLPLNAILCCGVLQCCVGCLSMAMGAVGAALSCRVQLFCFLLFLTLVGTGR